MPMEPEALPIDLVPLEVPATPPGLLAAVDCNGIMVVRLAPSVKTHVEPHNGLVMIAPVAEGFKVPVDEGSAVMYDSLPIGG